MARKDTKKENSADKKVEEVGVPPSGGGRKGGTNTAIPHMVAPEYRNTASQFT